MRFLRSGAFRKGPGPIPEAPGTLPDQILQRFCDTFLPVSPGSCRGLSGSAGMLPGYTASLRNSLCGVSLGYGDLAERIKFAVPRRGAGVLDSDQKSMPYPESLPLLTSPPGSAETVVLSRGRPVAFFFRLFFVFSVLEKTVKKRTVKKSTFSGNFGDFGASDVDFRRFWVPKRVSGGSSGRVFRHFFPDAVLHRFFVVFSVKNVKLEKMKKCVSICKLHTILEVAPSKKIRCLREKTLSIQA